MKAAERDELLIRIDERVKNIDEKTEQQEHHLEKINGHLSEHCTEIALLKQNQKTSKKAIAGYIAGASAVVAALIKSYLGGN